jgi:hypothetical protein
MMKFTQAELGLLSDALERLQEWVDEQTKQPGVTLVGMPKGLIPELRARVEAEENDPKYDDEPYWLPADIEPLRK